MKSLDEKMTATEFDQRLTAATERIKHETLSLEERNRRLADLLARKEAVAEHLEAVWREAEAERTQIDAAIARVHAGK